MRRYRVRSLARVLALTAIVWMPAQRLAWAQAQEADSKEEGPGHAHEKASAHGGQVSMTEAFHFEVVFQPGELRVYAYDGTQKPVMILSENGQPITGKVSIQFQDKAKQPLELTLERAEPEKGEREDYLRAKTDLSKVGPNTAKAVFTLANLPSGTEAQTTFTQKVVLPEAGHHKHPNH